MTTYYKNHKFIIVILLVWFFIQLFKVICDRIETKKWHWRRMFGAGGMPSSHSATVVCLATLMGKYEGIDSPAFVISFVFAMIVMYDAAGVRRAVGKQAKVLNDILSNTKTNNFEKLQEMTGHTPVQVVCGAIIGLIVGLIC